MSIRITQNAQHKYSGFVSIPFCGVELDSAVPRVEKRRVERRSVPTSRLMLRKPDLISSERAACRPKVPRKENEIRT
ncbi:hypothetical protein A0H81_01262 [Grifola frondosa]|uniref:Uncharacterized protein n=1 Tax=Grifola frondosa TaxID=5627 RepID=A0A1C7MRA2_GRIFR|nr:hypothetical protein A0H81_01262 [Grifola frondosa]